MNKRIEELKKLAMTKTVGHGAFGETEIYWDLDTERFALLVIEECAKIAEQASGYRLPASTYGDLIRKFEPLRESDHTVKIE